MMATNTHIYKLMVYIVTIYEWTTYTHSIT